MKAWGEFVRTMVSPYMALGRMTIFLQFPASIKDRFLWGEFKRITQPEMVGGLIAKEQRIPRCDELAPPISPVRFSHPVSG